MELKYAVDFSNKNTAEAIITGVALGILGLVAASCIGDLGWLKEIRPLKLSAYILLTMVAGTFIHEAYHLCVAKLLGYDGSLKLFPVASFVSADGMTKWAALGIKLAPATDLTLITFLIIVFLPSPLNPLLMVFLVGNLAGSGNDVLQSYYIFNLAGPNSRIRLTAGGFEIWE